MNPAVVEQAITQLRMISWGGLLLILDIDLTLDVDGQELKIDMLNDVLGAILVAWGVFRLREAPVHHRYRAVMNFVAVAAALSVLDAIRAVFSVPLAPAVSFVLNVFGLVALAAIVAFCVAMRWFCEAGQLAAAARSWSVTTGLFVAIYLVPLGLFYNACILAIVAGKSFNINLGLAGLPLVAVFALPIIHLFISTSRMKRAAEEM